jgi:hypothetical protein
MTFGAVVIDLRCDLMGWGSNPFKNSFQMITNTTLINNNFFFTNFLILKISCNKHNLHVQFCWTQWLQVEFTVPQSNGRNNYAPHIEKANIPMERGGYLIYGTAHMHTGAINATLYGQVSSFFINNSIVFLSIHIIFMIFDGTHVSLNYVCLSCSLSNTSYSIYIMARSQKL